MLKLVTDKEPCVQKGALGMQGSASIAMLPYPKRDERNSSLFITYLTYLVYYANHKNMTS